MDPILRKAFTAARAGHEGLLAGFGIERFIIYGGAAPPNSRQWEDRLSILGSGTGEYRTLRPLTDEGGGPAGFFRGAVGRQDIVDVIGLIEETGLLDAAPFRIEPGDMLIRVSLIIGGMHVVKFVGINDPVRLSPLQPLFNRLQQIELQLKRSPVRSLEIEMALPTKATTGVQQLPVTLRFTNRGSEALWLNHPRSLGRGAYTDRCTMEYGFRPPPEPGVTPLPIELMETSLRSEAESGIQMIWLAPGTSQDSHLVAEVNFHRPGEFLARGIFSNYDGEDAVGGVPRFRGCVFTVDRQIQVGE